MRNFLNLLNLLKFCQDVPTSAATPPRQGAEAGMALVSCTVILCAVLVLALASQQQVRQAQALAANLLDRNMALQAAEAALLDAEAAIQSAPLLAVDPGAGLSPVHTYGGLTGHRLQAARMPRFQIAVVTLPPGGSAYFYRITAQGFGQRESTQVRLQSDFMLSPNWQGRLAWRELPYD